MVSTKRTFKEMSSSNKFDECLVPQLVKKFLGRCFDASQYEDRKKKYLLLKARKENDFLKHLEQSYALIHFWRHMFLGMLDESEYCLAMVDRALEGFIERMVEKSGNQRPDYSFPALIMMAIESSAEKRLALNEIYESIMDKFPYFRALSEAKRDQWRNTVRHTLSIKECFVRQPGHDGQRKRNYWSMNPSYDYEIGDNLLNAPNDQLNELEDMKREMGQSYDDDDDDGDDDDVDDDERAGGSPKSNEEDTSDLEPLGGPCADGLRDRSLGRIGGRIGENLRAATAAAAAAPAAARGTSNGNSDDSIRRRRRRRTGSSIAGAAAGNKELVVKMERFDKTDDIKLEDTTGYASDDGDDDALNDAALNDDALNDDALNDAAFNDDDVVNDDSTTPAIIIPESREICRQNPEDNDGRSAADPPTAANDRAKQNSTKKVKKKRKVGSGLKRKKFDDKSNDVGEDRRNEKEKDLIVKRRIVPEEAKVVQTEQLKDNEFYIRKGRREAHDDKRKRIIEDGSLKEHSAEALIFLQRERVQWALRRQRRKIPPSKVKCQICHKNLHRLSFNHALLSHGIEYRDACAVCLETNHEAADLLAHYRVSHFGDTPLHCNLCAAVFYSPRELQNHIVSHTTVEVFKCTVCRFNFESEEKLEEHKLTHKRAKAARAPPKACQGTCEICGALITAHNASALAHRLVIHKGCHQPNPKYKCPMCPKEFSQEGHVRTHYARVHTPDDVRPFVCRFENCNKGFKAMNNLRDHQTYHKPPKFKCDKCLKQFYWKQVWRSHKCPAVPQMSA